MLLRVSSEGGATVSNWSPFISLSKFLQMLVHQIFSMLRQLKCIFILLFNKYLLIIDHVLGTMDATVGDKQVLFLLRTYIKKKLIGTLQMLNLETEIN